MKSVKNLIWILVAFELLNSCATKKAKVDELDEIFKEGFEISWSDPKAGGRLFQKGSELAQKRNNQVMHALFLVNLGAIATTTGNYPKALDYYAQSLELQRTLPNHEEVEARILASIGKTYEDLGDFSKAEIHFKEAVAITQRIKQQWDESTFMGDLGRIYTKLGDPRKALEQHQLALEVAESLNDKERQGVAWDNIGLVFIEQKDYIKALEAFQKALSLSTDTGGFPDPYWINLHISDLYLAQQSPKALQNLPKNLDSIRLGYFHLQNNNYELAQTQFEKTIESGKTLRRANQLVSGYLGLALTLENRENISQARDTYDLAIAEIERQRDLLPLTARQTFLSGKAEGFLPRLEAYQGRARVSKDPAEGFYWTEYTKARVFVESLSEKFRNKASELPLDLALVERESSEKILSLSKQMNLAFERNKMDRHRELEPELKKAKEEQSQLVKVLREKYPKYASLIYPQPSQANAVALNTKEILLEYEVTQSKTLLFVLRRGEPVTQINIPIQREALEKLVHKFRHPFENPLTESGNFANEYDSESGAQLFKLLFEPVLGMLRPDSEITIVPSEILGLLPYEALKSDKEAKYVGETFNIAYSQSATSLAQARTLNIKSTDSKSVLILADPIFDNTDARFQKGTVTTQIGEMVAKQENNALQAVAQRMSGGEENGFARLADTGLLAKKIRALFGKDASTLVGLSANKQILLKMKLDEYQVLVFATHGILDQDVPYIREPALVLSLLDKKGNERDGFLKMSEVMGLKLNAEIVALTACKTGLGNSVGGEGVMGLGRAFQYAGAKNVLVSLWSVAEKSTTLLTQAVLENLKAGEKPRQALRKARLKIRKLGFDHPFFWAPFVIVGS